MQDNKEVQEVVNNKEPLVTRGFAWGYIFYAAILIYAGYFWINMPVHNINIAVVTDIKKVLFSVLSQIAIRWLPVFSLIGLLMTLCRNRLKDITLIYMVFTTIVVIIMTVGLCIK